MIWFGKSFINFYKSFINLIKLVSTRTCSSARVGFWNGHFSARSQSPQCTVTHLPPLQRTWPLSPSKPWGEPAENSWEFLRSQIWKVPKPRLFEIFTSTWSCSIRRIFCLPLSLTLAEVSFLTKNGGWTDELNIEIKHYASRGLEVCSPPICDWEKHGAERNRHLRAICNENVWV